jgi:hypothetical protein
MEIISVCYEINTKEVEALWGHNVRFFLKKIGNLVVQSNRHGLKR